MSPAERLVALVATTAALVAVLIDPLSNPDTAASSLDVAATGAVIVGFAVLLFAGAVPRAKAHAWRGRGAAETAAVTSVIGFLSAASAWTGLPLVLGAGGAMLGSAAREHGYNDRDRSLAGFAILVGVSAVALGVVTVAIV
jgi:hypothetical protein